MNQWVSEPNDFMKTVIFTETEQKEFELRLQGEKKNYKIWYRVKPKLYELLKLFLLKKQIEKLLVVRKSDKVKN